MKCNVNDGAEETIWERKGLGNIPNEETDKVIDARFSIIFDSGKVKHALVSLLSIDRIKGTEAEKVTLEMKKLIDQFDGLIQRHNVALHDIYDYTVFPSL